MKLRIDERLRRYFARTAQNLEDAGNPNAAATVRATWGLTPNDVPSPKPKSKKRSRPKPDPVDSVPLREAFSRPSHRSAPTPEETTDHE